MFFVFGVAHRDPIFAQICLGKKMVNFWGFSNIFITTEFQLKLLILIEGNIFHWKLATKIKVGVVLVQNLGLIRSNNVAK